MQLALGTVGAVIGSYFGPLGASIGWTLGSAIGGMLDPKKVEGPRLSDRKLHTSSYGEMVTIIFGTMRAAGNVFWIGNNGDLVEHTHTEGGKGGPEQITYTYTASFAIGLCEGVMSRVARIWADNELIYDIHGEHGSTLPCTFYPGSEDQLQDPRMVAEDGADETPAYRGTCYVVFEDMDLAPYGNRIPSMSFEIEEAALQSAAMRVVDHNYARVQTWVDPQITDWTMGADEIRIAEVGPNREFVLPGVVPINVRKMDVDLIDAGLTPTLPSDAFPYNFWITPGGFPLVHVGMYRMNAEDIPLWKLGNTVTLGTTDPSITSSSVTSDALHTYGPDIAGGAGVPFGFHIDACCLSMSRDLLFVIGTADDTPGAPPDTWYRIGNGEVIATGTCDLPGSINSLTLSLEDNWRWMWAFVHNTGRMQIYSIDDDGVLSLNVGVGDILINPAAGGVAGGGIKVIAEGYCGVVTSAGDIAVLTRFPIGASVAVPLPDVVLRLAAMCHYDPAEIDVTDLADDRVQGYMISSQMSGRDAMLPLQSAHFFDMPESGGVLKAVKRGHDEAVTIPEDDLAAHVADEGELPALQEIERFHEEELPATLNLVYVNARTDYQNSTQIERRMVTSSQLETTITLAMNLTDQRAKQIAQATIASAWMERMQFKWATSSKYAHLEPSDVIIARGYRLRITQKTDGANDVIQFEGVRDFKALWIQGGVPQIGTGITPVTGRTPQGTDYELLDVPLLADDDDQFGFRLAMAGRIDDTWRGGVLYRSSDGGASYSSVAADGTSDPMGLASTVLGDFFGGNQFDELNTVDVALTAGSAELEAANQAAVLNGSNIALLGNEVFQFKNADLIGDGAYRLSGLLRGRRGTEFATAGHTAGERFVLLDQTTVVPAPLSDLNQPRKYKGVTSGGVLASATARDFTNMGAALRPYAPVHVGGGIDASGNATLFWTRRTRIGGVWIDFVDVQLGEDSEKYVVEIWDAGYAICARSTVVTAATTLAYSAAQQVTDFGATQETIYFTVAQIGTYRLGSRTRASLKGAGGSDGLPLVSVPPYASPPGPPPTSTNPVDHVMSWHSDSFITPAFAIGETKVVSFTTSSTPYDASNLLGGEYTDPAYYREAVLALDSGGTNVVATAPGNQFGFYFGTGIGQTHLLPSTTYYCLIRTRYTNGSPSGPLGASCRMIINLN